MSAEQLTLQPVNKIDGTVNVPGSKSLSNRALLLAAQWPLQITGRFL